jgi:uncharacterized membrane protein
MQWIRDNECMLFCCSVCSHFYYFLQHAVQAATAGVIGTWWITPDGGKVVIKRSAFKTMFYSMGSICFGGLFVGPVRLIRQLLVLFRPNQGEVSLMCLHECLHCIQSCVASCVDSLSDYFNPWAYTYIGLYGYGFLEAGVRATELFEKRGWTTIVSDDLVPNVLLMTSLVVGGATGCFAHLLELVNGLHMLSFSEHGLVSFWVGSAIGLVLTSVLFGVITSAVNAVVVCFATKPVDFERNHPELSHEMRSAWREVWPGALDSVDIDTGLAAPGMLHPHNIPAIV